MVPAEGVEEASLSTKEGWNKATNGMAPSMGGLRKEIYDIAGKLGALTEKGGALHKGMLEQAKSQIQKQKDTLHAALAEAGGGILAGGSPLLAQESVNAAKAMVDAEYKFALAQSQLYGQQAGILAGLLAEQGRMDLAEAAQKLAQDKFAETKDMNAWKKKHVNVESAINFIKAFDLVPDDETIGKLAGILAGDIEVSDEELAAMFKTQSQEDAEAEGDFDSQDFKDAYEFIESESDDAFVDERAVLAKLKNLTKAQVLEIKKKIKAKGENYWRNIDAAMRDENFYVQFLELTKG